MSRKVLMGAVAALYALSAIQALAEPRSFATPEEAVAEVIGVLDASDRDGLLAIFGPENEDVILSGDLQRDIDDWGNFLRAYREMNRITLQESGTARLYIGRDQYPVPIPLAEGADGTWRFDAEAAREEMLDERVGRNELDVIELLKGYVRVQARFRQTDYDGNGVMEFASNLLSDADRRDGLYWPPAEGAPESPVGDFVARASAIGYSIGDEDVEPEPYLGYYYHVLQKQGPDAPGGAMDYVINGNMVAGHALIAFPSAYGDTGIMSFMVGENGIVYEADLGENTLEAAAAINRFNPGKGWAPVD